VKRKSIRKSATTVSTDFADERCSSGVEGLDDILAGGVAARRFLFSSRRLRLRQDDAGASVSSRGSTPRREGLLHHAEILEEDGETSVRDAGIIVAAQKVEHYEIAGYGSVRTFAHLLGQNKAAELLQATLDEESETNEVLNRLAESVINPEAVRDTELAGASSDR
jgi:hypothetical protein